MRKTNVLKLAAIGITAVLTVTACSSLDVVGKQSVKAFEAILKAIPENVTHDDVNGGWSIKAPDGVARFFLSEDYSKSEFDVMIEFDAKPFLDAGLDLSKLPDTYMRNDDVIAVSSEFGSDKLTYDGESTVVAAYKHLVKKHRDSLKYHEQKDHHGISVGNGNSFEWANDLSIEASSGNSQKLDMVFALNPEPLIAAGVTPENVDGWSYGTVTVMKGGKKVEVFRFLKTFDLG